MEKPLLTVHQLNSQVRLFLEHDIGEISVVGELSNVSKPASGHFYFTLKDDKAQLKCAFFRNYHTKGQPSFTDGQQVIARGLLSLYEARGDYQLIVYELTPYGLGELYRQFELLKEKLEKQGLFAASRKRPLPRYPQRMAIITSKNGAALQDILITLRRRYPLVAVDIYPCEVQGKQAAQQLIKRLTEINQKIQHTETLPQQPFYDVIILARGGGSLEDLWAFNDEQLAFAIFNSVIPVVAGIGHESDFTIADFVADFRAATPTAAAQAATPCQEEIHKLLAATISRLGIAMQRVLHQKNMLLANRMNQLTYPIHLIHRHAQQIDFLQKQLQQTLQQRLRQQQHRLDMTRARLLAQNPVTKLQYTTLHFQRLHKQLIDAIQTNIALLKQRLTNNLVTLHAVSPLATLERGYAIASYQNHVLAKLEQVPCGATIQVRLADGLLLCDVLAKEPLSHA